MDQIEEFTDGRQKSWCIHCGAWLTDNKTTRDHVPSKGFLVAPYPENLPVVDVCNSCNGSFSHDEEYMIAFIGAVLAGSVASSSRLHPTAERILNRNDKLRERIEKTRTTYETPTGETQITWRPEQDRIDRVILKNARGHAFFELGEPLTVAPEHVWSVPLVALSTDQRAAFEDISPGQFASWPEVGSRMMTRLCTGQDFEKGWVIVQDGIYRYAVCQTGGVLVRTVLFEYLATEIYWEN